MNVMRWARTQWDRVGAWFLIALGGLFIVVGWVRVGREALTAQQIPYIISGGIGGLFLLGLGAMLWLSADLRDEWRKLDAIERQRRVEPDASSEPSRAEPDPFESKVARNGSSAGTGRRARLTARP